ncbi:alpha-glucosidase [Marivirga tractuosa]|uniref:Alpha amylase catalytic region n=1 Tax=Marivirga tractuosa (strain ATCC 23168 / DSM 4126 / NBRC 15989 / NCIMB 1408 / VKM B-1430 / H-43) TaxID=643867 RepID=E4TKH0_MARTH|nr:alpha-glucosidase [Marivirga tractuosa]ADR20150.1 alpha amylase catalytic region [Marivirga tractuosa DSM 4126]BDD15409.1 alpha-glucosidase [Marivirga tractuosa]
MTWWKEAIVYQIYPRSFKDSNGDGVGDLPGIISKLDYIQSIGVDVIWLCPIYQSPNDDNGYDVSDYRQIMTDFGNMSDFDLLLEGIHQRGMKLIMDIVPNHTSDEHRWFKASSESEDNPYRDYYIWRKGEKDKLPNNWPSFFSGNAWDYDEKTQSHYLHLFSKKQPDLNWENPKVRQEIYDIMHFWFKKGIDGFRMDVVSLISKLPGLPDTDSNIFTEIISKYYANGPKVHEYLREMNQEVLQHYDCMTVGEGPGITLDNALDYVGEDRNELHMVFHFGHMYIDNGPGGKYDPIPYNLVDMKKVFNAWDKKLTGKGWGSIFLGNHDFPRIVSRFGNDGLYWQESAKLLSTLLLSMRGTPYIFQGDEIGMTNVAYESIEEYRDIETLNSWKDAMQKGVDSESFMRLVHQQSRDNARTPFQWNNANNGGFSEGQAWLRPNDNFERINVEKQENEKHSVLNYYRKMVKYRKDNPTLVYGDYECFQIEHPELFLFKRSDDQRTYWVLLNFSEHHHDVEFEIPENVCLEMNNYPEPNASRRLRPWEAKIMQER